MTIRKSVDLIPDPSDAAAVALARAANIARLQQSLSRKDMLDHRAGRFSHVVHELPAAVRARSGMRGYVETVWTDEPGA